MSNGHVTTAPRDQQQLDPAQPAPTNNAPVTVTQANTDPTSDRRYPTGEGYRRGRMRVVEWMTVLGEKVVDTWEHFWLYAAESSRYVANRMAEMAMAVGAVPAQVLQMFPWGEHLLTEETRAEINQLGQLFVIAGMLKFTFWLSTLVYAMTLWEATSIAGLLVTLDILVERSFAMTDRTVGPLIKKTALKWHDRVFNASTARYALTGLRVGFIIVFSIANAEAMRIRLASDEIEAEIAAQEEETNMQLRAQRQAQIDQEMARRTSEANTANTSSLQAWNTQRAEARATLVTQRNQAEAALQREVERHNNDAVAERQGRVSRDTGVGRNVRDTRQQQAIARQALERHQRETVQVLANFDRETNEGRVTRENTARNEQARLNSERDRRTTQLRGTPVEVLGAQAGRQTRRSHGIWARREALRKVHEKNESSRHGDWFVQIVLMCIEMMGLVASRNGNMGRIIYNSLRAHAEAMDGSPENLRARAQYRAVLTQDPSVAQFRQDVYTVYTMLADAYPKFLIKVAEIAISKDAQRFTVTRQEANRQILEAWTSTNMQNCMAILGRYQTTAESVRFALYLLGELESATDKSLPALPAWPSLLGPDARKASPVISLNDLAALYGWRDSSGERREREKQQGMHLDAQERLEDALEAYEVAFPGGPKPEEGNAARALYNDRIRPAVTDLNRAWRYFTRKGLMQPQWIGERDPRPLAKEISHSLTVNHDVEEIDPLNEEEAEPESIAAATDEETIRERVETLPGPRPPFLKVLNGGLSPNSPPSANPKE